jgi:hypothetical protein
MNGSSAAQRLRDLIEAEFSSGFAFVRRIPSTGVWKSLAYIDALGPEDRNVLFAVLAERGSAGLDRDVPAQQIMARQQELVRQPAYLGYVEGRMRTSPAKYADPRFLRQWLEGLRAVPAGHPAPPPDFSPVPLAVVEAAEPPATVRAPDIRKEVKRALVPRFHLQPTNQGGGVWRYSGEYEGRPFTLTLDFGGSFHKLRYGVGGATWEGTLGLGIGFDWDFVCRHNLTESVALLGEIIEKIVLFPEQIGGCGPRDPPEAHHEP